MQPAQEHSYSKSERQTTGHRCHHRGCTKPSTAIVENAPRCPAHFIATCYAKIAELARIVEQKDVCGTELRMVRAFVAKCNAEAISLAMRARELNNRERAQLLDIVLSAAQLLTRLRRSPRVEQQIPVRLLGDPITNPRVENTMTRTLSKHGAMLSCGYPYVRGEILDIVRLDNGYSATARVVWHQPMAPGQHRVALEILNRTNFWNWVGAPLTRSLPGQDSAKTDANEDLRRSTAAA